MKKKIAKQVVHLIFPARKKLNNYLKKISGKFENSEILEIGSNDSKLNFSAKDIFKNAKLFHQTDVDSKFGHDLLDIRYVSKDSKKYDLVLCCNILEHVYENKNLSSNLKKLVKKDGYLLVSVPFIYPLHEEPMDYWRYTEHNLKLFFKDFYIDDFQYNGLREFPYQYIMLLKLSK